MQYPVISAVLITFTVTVAFLLALRPVAFGTKFVDHPGGRKMHTGDVPIIGGIAMFIGVLAGMAVIGIVSVLTVGIFVSFFLLVLVGAIDDAYGVAPIVRVLVQLAAIIIMVHCSETMLYSLGNPFGFGEIQLGPFALVGTLMVAFTVINAYNLIDGVDGLAGILALIALVGIVIIGPADSASTIMSLIVGSSIFGFLIFNLPVVVNRRIRTFMGDAGSTVLGFTIFWATLGISQGGDALISPVAGLWLAAIPVFDSLTCFVRRIASGKSPFSPGRDHFHHTLQRGGFGVQQTLAILGGLQIVYATIGLVGYKLGLPDFVLFALWSVLGLTQRLVIRGVSKRHRLYIFRKLRAGQLSPYLAARARMLK